MYIYLIGQTEPKTPLIVITMLPCYQDLSSLGDMSRDLALSLTDSRHRAEGPEPQYAETKSSILRSVS